MVRPASQRAALWDQRRTLITYFWLLEKHMRAPLAPSEKLCLTVVLQKAKKKGTNTTRAKDTQNCEPLRRSLHNHTGHTNSDTTSTRSAPHGTIFHVAWVVTQLTPGQGQRHSEATRHVLEGTSELCLVYPRCTPDGSEPEGGQLTHG